MPAARPAGMTSASAPRFDPKGLRKQGNGSSPPPEAFFRMRGSVMSQRGNETVAANRRGATCDARCRHGTTKRPRTASSRASGCEGTKVPRTGGFFLCVCNAPNPCGIRPAPANRIRPACHPGDMNVAPTVADCGRPVGAPLVTPGAGTAQWNAREWNSVRHRSPAWAGGCVFL